MSVIRTVVLNLMALLLTALGAAMAFSAPLTASNITYFQTETAYFVQANDVGFAARAPPMARFNVAVEGGGVVKQGNAFAVHGQETVAAFFGFDADFYATNTGTGARFADQAKLDDHFNRHGADFGATSSAQYQQMADGFLTGPRSPNTLERTRPNGDVVRYDPATDAFGVVSSSGTARTYYVPDPAVHGYPSNLDYFNAQ